MDKLFHKLLKSELGETTYDQMKPDLRQQLVNVLILYKFCHRHNKEDTFLVQLKEQVAETGNYISFDHIRPMLYNYSKKNLKTFMQNKPLAFLMFHFLNSEKALEFIK